MLTSFAAPLALIVTGAINPLQIEEDGPNHTEEPKAEAVDQESMAFKLERGEVLQVITPQSRGGARDARQAYYDQVLPIAESFGLRRLGQINVRQKVVADYDPGAFIFFSWPGQTAIDEFERGSEFPRIVAARPDGWEELRIYTVELQEDLSLRFDPDKHYSVVVAWTNVDAARDYDTYLQGIEPAVTREGGRFIYKMRNPRMEAHNSPPAAPAQLTFVEWSDPEAFARVQQSEEYLAHRRFFASGVERFEFFWLKVP